MKIVELKSIADVITKGTTPTSLGYSFEEEGINFVKIESIAEDGSFFTEKFAHINEECNAKLVRSQLKENDILFSIAGAIGRCAIVTKDILPANTNQALAIIRVPEGIFDYSFLLYYLQSPAITKQFEKRKQGVAQLNLSLKDIGEFTVPVMSIEKQKEVVCSLDRISNLIALRKQQLEKLDELVKARFVELFGEWKSKSEPLKSFLEDITYGFTNPMPDAEEGPWKVTAKDVVNGKVNYDTARKTTVQAYEELTAKSKPAVGDVLLTKDGTLGRCAVVEEEGICVNQSVAVLKCNKRIQPKFLAILLQMPEYQREMLKNAGGGTIKHIYITKVVDMLIMVPTISQQVEFLFFVEQTDKSKLAIQQSLEQLETLKKALMQQYFG